MKIEIVKPENFSDLEIYWRELESGEDMSAFQQYDWYKHINDLIMEEKFINHFRECVYIVALEKDKPLMIAPIQVIKFGLNIYYKKTIGQNRGFYFIGKEGYSDYLNFIYKDFYPEAAAAILSFLKNKYKFKNCYFSYILENTQFYKYIHANYSIINNIKISNAELVLPEKFDDYKYKLSKSMRQNIRTALNRQKKNNINFGYEIVLYIDEELKKKLYDVRKERLGKKQNDLLSSVSILGKMYYSYVNFIRKHFRAYHDVLKYNCEPWCFLVKDLDNGKIAGYFWGIRNIYQKTYYVILAGVEKEYAWYSPSISQFYKYIEELYIEDKNTSIYSFDFTRGGEKYKRDIGADVKNSYTIYFKLN